MTRIVLTSVHVLRCTWMMKVLAYSHQDLAKVVDNLSFLGCFPFVGIVILTWSILKKVGMLINRWLKDPIRLAFNQRIRASKLALVSSYLRSLFFLGPVLADILQLLVLQLHLFTWQYELVGALLVPKLIVVKPWLKGLLFLLGHILLIIVPHHHAASTVVIEFVVVLWLIHLWRGHVLIIKNFGKFVHLLVNAWRCVFQVFILLVVEAWCF